MFYLNLYNYFTPAEVGEFHNSNVVSVDLQFIKKLKMCKNKDEKRKLILFHIFNIKI